MADDTFAYRLRLLPLPSQELSDVERDHVEEDGWELVSAKVAEDGLTEQRMYRRPA